MDSSANVAQLSMDCEDMFKEITKKLYGEEAASVGGVVGVEFPAAEREYENAEDLRPEEHITAWGLAALMQNGFPPPGILQANFTPRTDPSAEDRWTAAEEPLAWAHSRIASYNPAQRLFKCCECECVGFLARVAEHWLGTHSAARVFHCPLTACGFSSGWARAVRHHLQRDHDSDPHAADHLLRDNPALDDLTRYLQRLKGKVEAAKNERRNETPPQHQEQTNASTNTASSVITADGTKRYACTSCPYATDRRDLFTRHENIHRDEKPFHCYLCQKQFNRADHVKKHFLRMHREHHYDLNRIRRVTVTTKTITAPPSQVPAQMPPQTAPTQHYFVKPPAEPPPQAVEYRPAPPIKIERLSIVKQDSVPVSTIIQQSPHHKVASAQVQVVNVAGVASAGVSSQVAATAVVTSRRKGERRYACCYCSWSGVDNWCLKRHLNTHLKPFACVLCEYKAARAERLATHVNKVHSKKACAKCPYLADDQAQLAQHLRDTHHIENRNLKVPSGVGRSGVIGMQSGHTSHQTVVATAGSVAVAAPRRREVRPAGAARLFGYLEASDGSGDEYETQALHHEYADAAPQQQPTMQQQQQQQQQQTQQYRDKENAAPSSAIHHHSLHEHCLRY